MNEISAVHISSNPFPVTKTFFGQTFAILSLLHLSEENGIGRKSVWCTHHPVREPRFLEYADTVSMEIVQRQLRTTLEYDADVKGGFPSKKFFDFMRTRFCGARRNSFACAPSGTIRIHVLSLATASRTRLSDGAAFISR